MNILRIVVGAGRYLDTAGFYQRLLDKGCEHVTETFCVCNSYEKWGTMQQEVVKIRVKMQRVEAA